MISVLRTFSAAALLAATTLFGSSPTHAIEASSPPAGARDAGSALLLAQTGQTAGGSAGQTGAVIDESRLQRRPRPVACVGRETIELTGVLLRADAVAVMASGDCEVRIKDSHIAGQIGVQVAGGGNVSIENSIIEGAVALQLAAGGVVSLKTSTIRGQVQRAGSVTLRDLGGNLWR